MMRRAPALLLALLPLAFGAPDARCEQDSGQKIWFGANKQYRVLSELEGKKGLTQVKTDWPFGADARYEGIPLKDLISEIPRDKSASADMLVVHCRDGFQAFIPLDLALTKPLVLVTRINGKGPQDWARYKGKELGLFVALPNAEQPDFNGTLYDHFWASQVEGLAWANLTPVWKDRTSAGRGIFVARCIHCHELSGFGGTRGPSFSRPLTQTGDFFLRYVKNPTAQNSNSEMPPFEKKLSDAQIRSVLEFLKSVSASSK